MFQSIGEDIKHQFQSGNMITRLILINVFVFVAISLLYVFTHFGGNQGNDTIYSTVIRWMALNSSMEFNAWHPWVFISHMFLHEGFWHLLWNMLFLYWFGRIVGDLLGDHRIWPLYILGGLAGAIGYLLSALILGRPGIALGASGAVMAMVMAAATTAPDYQMRLLLIGSVRLKYIAAVLFFIDLIGLGSMDNTGGHFAHIGGAVFGWYFVFCLRRGLDFSSYVNQFSDGFLQLITPSEKKSRPTLVKVPGGLSKQFSRKSQSTIEEEDDLESKVDAILDKIRKSGFESLTEEEKEILYKASKE